MYMLQHDRRCVQSDPGMALVFVSPPGLQSRKCRDA